MTGTAAAALAGVAVTMLLGVASAAARIATQGSDDAFLTWSRGDAAAIVNGMRRTDRVGSRMTFRGLKTDRAINYKLRATWLTGDVIRATARGVQLDERVPIADVRKLVADAEAAADTVFFVELDPHEGSGVIPLDWIAILQPPGAPVGDPAAVRGVIAPKLREVRALGGFFKRDYAYDAFWVAFDIPAAGRAALFGPQASEVELVINIQGREGIVRWSIPGSVRERLAPR